MLRFLGYLMVYFLMVNYSIAASLAQMTVNDPALGARSITYKVHRRYAIVEGDIILGRIVNQKLMGATVVNNISGGHWPHGIVPFELSIDLPDETVHAVLNAMYVLQQHTNIKFVVRKKQNQQKYPDYLLFVPSDGKTCFSAVGKKGGQQEIILGKRCRTMFVVHEIMHALGFWHEQSRHDRDFFVRIVWENISEEHAYNFNQHLSESKDYGDYDYQSIMHYSATAFSKNGEPTIIPLQADVKIGQREKLSEGDIEAINAMYPES
ncbi:MAG: Dot/Icm T4SS effector Zinc-dependent metalloprotease LegP [Legionella sp.]